MITSEAILAVRLPVEEKKEFVKVAALHSATFSKVARAALFAFISRTEEERNRDIQNFEMGCVYANAADMLCKKPVD